MMRLKVEQKGQGLHPNEAVVAVQTDHGQERLVVSKRSIERGSIRVGWPLGERPDGYVLVELPRETETGAWRVWVPRNRLDEQHEERIRA
jgi:hypothetical protein